MGYSCQSCPRQFNTRESMENHYRGFHKRGDNIGSPMSWGASSQDSYRGPNQSPNQLVHKYPISTEKSLFSDDSSQESIKVSSTDEGSDRESNEGSSNSEESNEDEEDTQTINCIDLNVLLSIVSDAELNNTPLNTSGLMTMYNVERDSEQPSDEVDYSFSDYDLNFIRQILLAARTEILSLTIELLEDILYGLEYAHCSHPSISKEQYRDSEEFDRSDKRICDLQVHNVCIFLNSTILNDNGLDLKTLCSLLPGLMVLNRKIFEKSVPIPPNALSLLQLFFMAAKQKKLDLTYELLYDILIHVSF